MQKGEISLICKYVKFGVSNWRNLLFGLVLMTLSSFGQTFYISLFGPHLREEFYLSYGSLGAVYAAATITSAMSLTFVGQWIDRITVRQYAMGVAVFLSCACLMMAASHNLLFLFVSLYLLRLGGQGLMVHTSLTTTARTFPMDRGKALGITTLGLPLGEAVLPIIAVAGMAAIGWRSTWIVGGVIVMLAASSAIRVLPDAVKNFRARDSFSPQRRATTLRLWRDRRLLLTLPCVLASPFISTGFFFIQARLAAEKHWSLEFLAACFVGYAVARAFALLAIGPVIDKFGATRLLPFFLVPQGIAMATIALVSGKIGAPIYLISTGISAGIAATMATALWVEMYGVEELARVRSSVEAATVVATGLAPIVAGSLIDAGVPLTIQAGGCLFAVVAVSWVSRFASRHANPAQFPTG